MWKSTRWILKWPALYNTLIAIMTSAIVTLIAGGNVFSEDINYWILFSVLIAFVVIILLSQVSGLSQEVRSRQITLIIENNCKGDSFQDAFMDVIHLRNNNNIVETYNITLLIKAILITIMLISVVILAWVGENIKYRSQNEKVANQTILLLSPSVNAIEKDLRDMRDYFDQKLDKYSIENQVLYDSLFRELILMNQKSVKSVKGKKNIDSKLE